MKYERSHTLDTGETSGYDADDGKQNIYCCHSFIGVIRSVRLYSVRYLYFLNILKSEDFLLEAGPIIIGTWFL